MSARPVSEATTKNLLNRHLNDSNFQKTCFYSFLTEEKLMNDCNENQWLLNSSLVVKVDQGIKRRGKLGLVGLDFNLNKVLSWINERIGSDIKIGNATGRLKNFIIEPHVPHKNNEEHYLCIYSTRECDTILFYHQGGVDIGDVDSKAFKLDVPVNLEPSHEDINNCLLKVITCPTTKRTLTFFIANLYEIYRKLYFTYLEINPLVIKNGDKIYALDAAGKLDECAHYLMSDSWGNVSFPPPFGRDLYPEEEVISKMNASSGASLKLTLINPNGRIWTLVAGGGASVVFTDTICEYGGIDELANYGEYSGAPSEQQTYEYTTTIKKLMFKAPQSSKGKVLIIGGGIANFTNVADTFKGIIKSLEESVTDLKTHNVSVFVRRGGPNYQEGLRHMVELGERIDIPFYVFGPETHMTAIVGMALGKRDVMNNHVFENSSTTANFLLNFGFESWKKKSSISSDKINIEVSSNDSNQLFSSKTRAIVWGMHQTAVQSMLDFDYSCSRKFPSVAGVVNPFSEDYRHRFYWGQKEIFIPVYSKLAVAFEKHPDVDVFINFASLRSAYSVTLEAMEFKRIRTIAIIAEGIPENMTRKLISEAKRREHVNIIGPATVGGIKAGCFKIGNTAGMMDNILSSKLYRSGSVAYVSKSGGMSNELNNIIARCTDGVNEGIAIGGDRYPCTTFMDHIYRFENDPTIKIIVVLGEVGGLEEYYICDALKSGNISKPVVAWCIGTCSTYFSTDVQFGHAGSSVNSEQEMSVIKNKALAEAGAYVPDSFDSLAEVISEIYSKNVKNGNIVPVKDVAPPPVPMDYQWARELGLIRKPATVTSSICDERGCELLYAGIPISTILSRKMGIGGVLSLLWFKKALPVEVTEFIEMCLMLVADHGPAVSAAMNTIVASRAGKDLVSSLCSGLLTIGDRFGGAVDAAGRAFFDSVNSGISPECFVQTKRKNNQYIMGIGHRVKSVGNPDKRVKILTKYVKDRFESTPILDFALSVEMITTAKRPNLILNIDGAIGACLVELLTKCFNNEEVFNYINAGVLNAIFVLGRSIGLIGHHIDQKILRQDLYRHPWDDISYMNPDSL